MQTITVFIASSIDEFETERTAIGAFGERLIQAYRSDGIYFRFIRCEDETSFFDNSGAQHVLDEDVMGSDYVIVLVGSKVGQATGEELISACRSQERRGGPRVLVFVHDSHRMDGEVSALDVFNRLVPELNEDLRVGGLGATLESCINKWDFYWFSHVSQVNNILLKVLYQDKRIAMPGFVDSGLDKWIAHRGQTLIPVSEIGDDAKWIVTSNSDTKASQESIETRTKAVRLFVATSPDGRSDGTELLNFARVLNDIYHDSGVNFEAFVFNALRPDPNATDEVAENSQYFFIISRLETDESQRARLKAAIEAYQSSLDADGDGYPRILTFFEDADDVSSDVADLQRELSECGHYYSVFTDVEAIKYMVAIEVTRDMNKSSLRFSSGELQLNGLPLHINVSDIPIFKNHEKLGMILQELDRYNATDGDERGRRKLLDIASDLENCILDLSQRVSVLCSANAFEHYSQAQRERVKRVRKAYDAGNYDEVIDLLNRAEVQQEMDDICKRGRQAQEDMKITRELGRLCVQQERLLISAFFARGVTEDDSDVICAAYEQCIAIARDCDVEFDFLENYIQYLWHGEQHALAEDVCVRVLDMLDKYIEDGVPLTDERKACYARTLRQLADTVDNDTTRREEAVTYAMEALRMQQALASSSEKLSGGWRSVKKELVEARKTDSGIDRDIADTNNSLGVYYIHLKRFQEAKKYLWTALQERKRLREQGAQISDEILAKSYNNYATVLNSLGMFDEATDYHELSIAVRRADDSVGVVERDHYVAMSLNSYASHYYCEAKSLLNAHDVSGAINALAQAEELHREALAMREQLIKDNPRKFAPRLAASQKNLAGCILLRLDLDLGIHTDSLDEAPDENKGSYEEAEKLARASLETRKECEKEFPGMYVKVVEETQQFLNKCLARQGKLE